MSSISHYIISSSQAPLLTDGLRHLTRLELFESAQRILKSTLSDDQSGRKSRRKTTICVFLFTTNTIRILECLSACWLSHLSSSSSLMIPLLVSWDFIVNKNVNALRKLIGDATDQLKEYLQHQEEDSEIAIKFLSFDDASLEFAASVLLKEQGELLIRVDDDKDIFIPQTTQDRQNEEDVCDEDEIALILHTSGTTSTPLPILLSHKNILSNLQMTGNVSSSPLFFDDDQENDVDRESARCYSSSPSSSYSLMVLPMFHGFPILSHFLPILCSLISSTSSSSTNQKEPKLMTTTIIKILPSGAQNKSASALAIHREITESRIINVTICCVPSQFEQVVEELLVSRQNNVFSSSRSSAVRFIVGGAKLSSSQIELWTILQNATENNNIRFQLVSLLGMTELSGTVLFRNASNSLSMHFPVSVMKFISLNNDDVNDNVKELVISLDAPFLSPTVKLRMRKHVDEKLQIFHTRDLFRSCGAVGDTGADGNHEIVEHCGRLDDCFRLSNGKTINPILVETIFFSTLIKQVENDISDGIEVFVCSDGVECESNKGQTVSHYLVNIFSSKQIEITQIIQERIQSELNNVAPHYLIRDWSLQVRWYSHNNTIFVKTPKGSVNRRMTMENLMKLKNENSTRQNQQNQTNNNDDNAHDQNTNADPLLDFLMNDEDLQSSLSNLQLLRDDSIAIALFVSTLKSKLQLLALNITHALPTLVEFIVYFQNQADDDNILCKNRYVRTTRFADFIRSTASRNEKKKTISSDNIQRQQPSSSISLTDEQAMNFITKTLNIDNFDSLECDLQLFELLAQRFVQKIPFQSLTTIFSNKNHKNNNENSTFPTWSSVIESCLTKKEGGLCFVMNPFFGLLLQWVVNNDKKNKQNNNPFRIYFGRGTIHQVLDCHVTTFIEDVRSNRLYLLDVGCGYLQPVCVELKRRNDEDNSMTSHRKYNSLTITSTFDSDRNVWSIYHSSTTTKPELFMTTTAKEVPVFDDDGVSSNSSSSALQSAYMNYSKLRMSIAKRCNSSVDGVFMMLYLKAEGFDAETKEFSNCSVLEEKQIARSDCDDEAVIVCESRKVSSDELKLLIQKYFFPEFVFS